MIYTARKGQISYGEAIGILMLDTFTPFIPGDVGNASTYSFPVRYRTVKNLTVGKMLSKELRTDTQIPEQLLEAGEKLVQDGVKAITGDCGYMAIFQEKLANKLSVPVFLSSLMQVPFISKIIGEENKIGIMCANSESIDDYVLQKLGVDNPSLVYVKGLQTKNSFFNSVIKESGMIDSEMMEKEMVESAGEIVAEDSKVKAILLECSVMPPYGAAVQQAVGLPVFDYITMINYVYSAVIKRRYKGFM